MRGLSLGIKLTAWSSLVVGLALLICGIGAVVFIQSEQIEALDDQLRNEAHTFFGEMARQSDQLDGVPFSDIKKILPITRTQRFIRVLRADGHVLYESHHSGQIPVANFPPGTRTVDTGQGNLRLGVYRSGDLTLYLGAALSEINADESDLLLGLFVGLPLLIVTVAGGGWWLARKALAPVREITAATELITASHLDQRLPVPETRDEIARLARVLNAMFDRLQSSFHQATRFSADASHELKTPLTILRVGMEELLESPTLSSADQHSVATLLEQTHRLGTITEGLLLLSLADAGRLRLDLGEANIGDIVTACADDTSIIADTREISIVTQLPSGLTGRVDPGRLMQILLNLLDNAVKYNHQGGQIRIEADRDEGGRISIRVANTGLGIPEDKRSEIFGRFFRANGDPTAKGHGLGLNIARELTRAHGGDLVLEHSDAQWTTFVVQLAG